MYPPNLETQKRERIHPAPTITTSSHLAQPTYKSTQCQADTCPAGPLGRGPRSRCQLGPAGQEQRLHYRRYPGTPGKEKENRGVATRGLENIEAALSVQRVGGGLVGMEGGLEVGDVRRGYPGCVFAGSRENGVAAKCCCCIIGA
jgi:hypothetical protein